MAKNFFQDVVPPERRSIRNIPIDGSRRKKNILPPNENLPAPAFSKEKKRFPSGKVFVALAVIFVGGFIFSMMTVFTSASIDIAPKSQSVSFNLAVEAKGNPLPGDKTLKFEIIEIKKEGKIEVEANGEEMVEQKASGVIIIYNNFSKDNQRLITRTRFETPEGLIYRIAESITVPGKIASGPGQVEAVVYADETGEKYNIGKTDFTIPGFKSDPLRYKGFYAKSKTVMEGGFIGKVKKVAETDKKSALSELQNSLRTDLEKEIGAKIPDGFVNLAGGAIYEFKDAGQGESFGSKALLKSEVTAVVVAFDKQSLSLVLAKQYLSDWGELPVEIRSFNNMTVSFNPGFNISLDKAPSVIPIKISGSAEIFAAINGIEMAESLKGLPKSNLNSVMAKFPGVSSAKATIRPLWKTFFPSDTAKIHINVK